MRKRRTLFSGYSRFHKGENTKNTDFWVVTAFGAFLIFAMVLAEAVINWEYISTKNFNLIFTLTVILLTAASTVAPLILKERFGAGYGLAGFVTICAVLVYHIGFSVDPLSINTSIQVLPVVAIYIAWFWKPATSFTYFSAVTLALIVASFRSPMIGENIPTTVFIFAILMSWFSFLLGVSLRTQLRLKATTDPLTGAVNFRGLMDGLQTDIPRAKKYGEPLALALIDFDLLKMINDKQGHKYGDYALTTTVTEWREGTREYDTVARVGGDEFAIVFPRTELSDAIKILKRLKSEALFNWTWGVAELKDGDTVESLMKRADKELYAAKSLSKGSNSKKDLPEDSILFKEVGRLRKLRSSWWLSTPNELPIASLFLSFVVTISLTLAIFLGGEAAESNAITFLLIGSSFVMLILTLCSFRLSKNFPTQTPLIISAVIAIIYWLLLTLSENFYHSVSILFAFSIISIYLGVFSGTLNARVLSLVALTGASVIAFSDINNYAGTEERTFLTASVVYMFIVQFFLFEVGSHLYSQSRNLVDFDALTRVLNRNGLYAAGEAELRRASRGAHKISVVVLDCDNFKSINDTLGHQRGDELLQETATHLTKNLNKFDVVSRIGGDEFVLVLPYLGFSEALNTVQKIAHDSPIPFSFGIAEVEHGESLNEAISAADAKLLESRAELRGT